MFCPTGANSTFNLSGTAVSVPLTGLDPNTGAVRIAVTTSRIVYIDFAGTATVGSMQLNGPAYEVFKAPVGATSVSLYSLAADVSVTLGQDA